MRRIVSAATALVVGIAAATGVHANNVFGAWVSPAADNWPLIPIHAVLTPDGRVLSYGTDGTGRQTAFFIYDVWDPAGGLNYNPPSQLAGHVTLDNLTATDIFCSSQIILPLSGSIFIAGGDNWTGTSTTNSGNNNANIFSPTGNTLSRDRNSAGQINAMNRERWYSSSTVLPNGEIYIQGGNGGQRPTRGARAGRRFPTARQRQYERDGRDLPAQLPGAGRSSVRL